MTSRLIAVVFLLGVVGAPAIATAAPADTAALYDPAQAAAASQIQDPEAATQAYLNAVPAERRAKTHDYAIGGYELGIADFVVNTVVMILLIALGVSARFRNLAERLTRFRLLQSALYWIQLSVVITVIEFPLAVYAGYVHEKNYGLSNQSLGGFISDELIGLAVSCVLGAIVVSIVYAVLRRAPRWWWVWISGVLVVFVIFSVAISPLVISPLFNKFTPIADQGLRTRILDMAHAHDIPADEVYEMDASQRTDRISAYVTGMLGTMRIVMFDTALKRCTPDEIEMIMGHEMGHYVEGHIWLSIGLFSLLIVVGMLFVRWAFAAALRRWPNTGIRDLADPAGLPLLWVLFSLVIVASTPAFNAFGRHAEHAADNFGLDASKHPDAAATVFLKLGEYRDLDPSPVIELLFYDHPSGANRIRNAMQWKHAHTGT